MNCDAKNIGREIFRKKIINFQASYIWLKFFMDFYEILNKSPQNITFKFMLTIIFEF